MRGLAAIFSGVLAGCVLCSLASSASAQIPEAPTQPSESDFAVARDAFVEGIALAEQRAHRRALAAFERSYRLSGSSAALFNLASTLRHLARYFDADAAVTRLLAMPGLDAETRSRAVQVQRQARAQLAQLVIRDVPSGQADVLVDGRVRARRSERPIQVSLDPGLRVVRVELAGHPSFTWSDTIEAGASTEARARYAAQRDSGQQRSGHQHSANAGLDPATSSPDVPNWPVILGVGFGALALAAGGIVLGLVLANPPFGPRTDLVIRLP